MGHLPWAFCQSEIQVLSWVLVDQEFPKWKVVQKVPWCKDDPEGNRGGVQILGFGVGQICLPIGVNTLCTVTAVSDSIFLSTNFFICEIIICALRCAFKIQALPTKCLVQSLAPGKIGGMVGTNYYLLYTLRILSYALWGQGLHLLCEFLYSHFLVLCLVNSFGWMDWEVFYR